MGKDGKDKSKDKSTASKPAVSQGDGDSDIEEEQIKVGKLIIPLQCSTYVFLTTP